MSAVCVLVRNPNTRSLNISTQTRKVSGRSAVFLDPAKHQKMDTHSLHKIKIRLHVDICMTCVDMVR